MQSSLHLYHHYRPLQLSVTHFACEHDVLVHNTNKEKEDIFIEKQCSKRFKNSIKNL